MRDSEICGRDEKWGIRLRKIWEILDNWLFGEGEKIFKNEIEIFLA